MPPPYRDTHDKEKPMLLDFASMEETVHQNFKGGESQFSHRVFGDAHCRIMRGCLISGASIGTHSTKPPVKLSISSRVRRASSATASPRR